MLHGEGFVIDPASGPSFVTPPGYVFFLYLLYGLTGEEVNQGIRVQLVQPLLDAITCLLIYLLGVHVFRSKTVGLVAALGWALYPQIIVYSARVAPEVLFTMLLTAMVFALLLLLERGRIREAILLGILWGLAALVKEKIVILPPFLLLLVLLAANGSRGKRIVLVLVTALAMTLPVAPWLIRGYQSTGLLFPITLRSGRALNQGMNIDYTGAYQSTEDFFERQDEGNKKELPDSEKERQLQTRSKAQNERAMIGKAIDRISANPVAFIKSFFVKLAAFWYFGQPKVIVGNILVQIPILLLAIAGYIRGWKRYNLTPFLLVTLYFVLIHAVTITSMRFSLPIMPETFLVAVSFITPLLSRWKKLPR